MLGLEEPLVSTDLESTDCSFWVSCVLWGTFKIYPQIPLHYSHDQELSVSSSLWNQASFAMFLSNRECQNWHSTMWLLSLSHTKALQILHCLLEYSLLKNIGCHARSLTTFFCWHAMRKPKLINTERLHGNNTGKDSKTPGGKSFAQTSPAVLSSHISYSIIELELNERTKLSPPGWALSEFLKLTE